MSIDDLRTIDGRSPIETDLCLIGSGPAGWAIAEELRDSGLRILMLESGGRQVEPACEALNAVEDVGVRLFNGRTRILGGTSHVWNGRCMPFDDIDYQPRDWVPHSGWPFDAQAMAPYVDRASEHLGAGPYYQGSARRPIPPALLARPAVDPALMRSTWWENPVMLDFGQVLATRRGANLWVLTHATVTHLNTDPSGRRIHSVEVADADGRRLSVHARAFVLCAGGIENPRILLYSNRSNPAGLGNGHDWVGRTLMDHPRDFELIARIDMADADRFRALFGPHRLPSPRGPHHFSYGFVLSPERVRRERLLNAAAWPYEDWANDDPFAAARRLVKDGLLKGGLLRGPRGAMLRDARVAASQPKMLLQSLRTRLRREEYRPKVTRLGFLVSSEQIPNPDSRVELSETRDWLGLPISRTRWKVSELEARSQAVLAQSIEAEFARLGLPPIRLAAWVREGRFADANFVDGCHPSGTTRMAADPAQGVVDADCQVHGIDGLFVAGSSVFPTAGHANPTLMLVALAVRLAQHLRQRLATKAPAMAIGTAAATTPGTAQREPALIVG